MVPLNASNSFTPKSEFIDFIVANIRPESHLIQFSVAHRGAHRSATDVLCIVWVERGGALYCLVGGAKLEQRLVNKGFLMWDKTPKHDLCTCGTKPVSRVGKIAPSCLLR